MVNPVFYKDGTVDILICILNDKQVVMPKGSEGQLSSVVIASSIGKRNVITSIFLSFTVPAYAGRTQGLKEDAKPSKPLPNPSNGWGRELLEKERGLKVPKSQVKNASAISINFADYLILFMHKQLMPNHAFLNRNLKI